MRQNSRPDHDHLSNRGSFTFNLPSVTHAPRRPDVFFCGPLDVLLSLRPDAWCDAQGWFESVYLDEDFRVTRDVRGDVTVLVKGQSWQTMPNLASFFLVFWRFEVVFWHVNVCLIWKAYLVRLGRCRWERYAPASGGGEETCLCRRKETWKINYGDVIFTTRTRASCLFCFFNPRADWNLFIAQAHHTCCRCVNLTTVKCEQQGMWTFTLTWLQYNGIKNETYSSSAVISPVYYGGS